MGAVVFLKNGATLIATKTWYENDWIYCQTSKKVYSFKEDEIQQIGKGNLALNSDENDLNRPKVISYETPAIKWTGINPYIQIDKNTWKSISGAKVKINGHVYTYRMDEDNFKNGKLFKDGQVVKIYKNRVAQSVSQLKKHTQDKMCSERELNNKIINIKNRLDKVETLLKKAERAYETKEYNESLLQIENASQLIDYEYNLSKYKSLLKEGDHWNDMGWREKAFKYYDTALNEFCGLYALSKHSRYYPNKLKDDGTYFAPKELPQRLQKLYGSLYFYKIKCLIDLKELDKAKYEFKQFKSNKQGQYQYLTNTLAPIIFPNLRVGSGQVSGERLYHQQKQSSWFDRQDNVGSAAERYRNGPSQQVKCEERCAAALYQCRNSFVGQPWDPAQHTPPDHICDDNHKRCVRSCGRILP